MLIVLKPAKLVLNADENIYFTAFKEGDIVHTKMDGNYLYVYNEHATFCVYNEDMLNGMIEVGVFKRAATN